MTKKLIVVALLFCSTLLVLTRQPRVLAAPFLQDNATTTPAPEEEAAATPAPAEESAAEATTAAASEPTVADLLGRLDALQAQVDELEEHLAADHEMDDHSIDEHSIDEHSIDDHSIDDHSIDEHSIDEHSIDEHSIDEHSGAADVSAVTTAVYLLDTAGLHDLDVRLNEEQVIDPSDAGRVARVARLLSSVDWPEPLATEIVTLTTALSDLTTALTNDDLETAVPLATLVHEAQHDFSHAVEHWAEDAATTPTGPGQAFRVTSAVYLLDTAGLHDLDVRLNEEKVLDPSAAGRVARVSRLLAAVDWPEPLATEVMTLTTALRDLTTALTNDDLETAAPLATLVHEVQHDFSHAAEHWLGETLGTHDAGDAGHGEEGAEHDGEEHDGEETEGEGDEAKDSSGG